MSDIIINTSIPIFKQSVTVLTLHVDRGVVYQTNSILELYKSVVLDSLYIQLCGHNLRLLWTSDNGTARVHLGLIRGALRRVDAPPCTGCVKRMRAGAQREASMTTDSSLCHPVPITTASEVTETNH